jgi:hypothetical protein
MHGLHGLTVQRDASHEQTMGKSIRELEIELGRLEAAHTAVHYELLQARSAKLKADGATAAAIAKAGARRRAEIDDELPENPVARAIVQAGCRRRGEIQ